LTCLGPVLQVMRHCRLQADKSLRLILHSILEKQRQKDKREISHIVYSFFRYRLIIDSILAEYGRRSKTSPQTFDLLRVAFVLLFFSRARPLPVTVNEVVKKACKNDKPYLNAVLRALTRNHAEISADLSRMLAENPQSAFPLFLQREFSNLGLTTADLGRLLNEPVFHFRVAPGPKKKAVLAEILSGRGIEHRYLPGLNSFMIKELTPIRDVLEAGNLGYLQNTASQAVAEIAAGIKAGFYLDACAAPGAKALTLALKRPQSRVLANDLNLVRLLRLQQRIKSLAVNNIELLVSDLKCLPLRQTGFDLLLLDAPCSAPCPDQQFVRPRPVRQVVDPRFDRESRRCEQLQPGGPRKDAGQVPVVLDA